MSIARVLLLSTGLATALIGCNNGDDDGDGAPGSDSGPGVAPSFTFKTTVPAVGYDAEVSEVALRAHQAANMIVSSAKVVAADEKVQDRLNTDGAGGYLPGGGGGALPCWARPQFPMFSFDIDYTPCASNYLGGGVKINDHPSGPLLFEFFDFVERERQMGGVLAFDTREAFEAPLYWEVYTTAAENPGSDNPVQMGIELDDNQVYGVSYSGGASVSFIDQQWAMWGVATIGVGDDAIEVVHGAADPADVAPDSPTGADVVSGSLNWLACRCPTSGVEAQDMPLEFSKVTLDIDDFEDEPDAVDDPTFDVEVEYTLPGRGVLTHTGCGTYAVDFTSEPSELQIPWEQIEGAISFLCTTLEINDVQRCAALTNAARANPFYAVEITAAQATATAEEAVQDDFDNQAWCSQY